VVRCGYHLFTQRREDVVLAAVVAKTETIRRELGSLGDVLMRRVETVLAEGIDDDSAARLEVSDEGPLRKVVAAELDAATGDQEEKETIGEILNRSQEFMPITPGLLQGVVNAGLELANRGPLIPVAKEAAAAAQVPEAFAVAADEPNGSWAATLDTLRPARGRDESFSHWRQGGLKPVVFKAPTRMTDEVVHLHLAHPLVQRLLSRFRAQGWAAHDLARVTVLRNDKDALARVIAIGRLTLFGPGAIRLHEELVFAAARWREGKEGSRLKPFAEKGDAQAVDRLQELLAAAPADVAVAKTIERKLSASAAADFAALWPRVQAEAESRQHEAATKLRARGRVEAEALATIIDDQRREIEAALADKQIPLGWSSDERTQLESDRHELARRLRELPKERETEPRAVERRYEVVLKRVEAVGLVYLYPEVG
jgi:hypothetical protein